MSGADDFLPRLADACRRAAAAADETPAARPSYWQLRRAVARQAQAWLLRAVTDGCTFPDRPVRLEADAASLLNFGLTPALARRDAASPEAAREALSRAAASWQADPRRTLVYSLGPWLQDQYRELLDVDYADELRRELEDCRHAMDQAPRQLAAIGLSEGMAREVMDAFGRFQRITSSSYQLERDKSSFGDRRAFVAVRAGIENALERAADSLARAGGGRARLQEIFASWKNLSYRAMELGLQLRAVWAGTRLDAKVRDLARLLSAVFAVAAQKCPDPDRDPLPPSGLLLAGEADSVLDGSLVREAFEALMAQDVVAGGPETGGLRDLRRHGPLCALVVPGTGRVRFGGLIRQAAAEAGGGDGTRTGTVPDEHELDPVRRLRYPVSCLVVPHRAPAAALGRQMAEAWFEAAAAIRPAAAREALEHCRLHCPQLFDPPPGLGQPAAWTRQRFVDCLAAYIRWNRTGRGPAGDGEVPADLFGSFVAWARGREARPPFVAPLRHRGWVAAYRAMSRRRRDSLWRRVLGPRGQLDLEGLALRLVRCDFASFFAGLGLLPQERRQGPLLARARQEMEGQDPYGDRDRKVGDLLRRFMEEDPGLKEALLAVDTAVAIETETRRVQAESLGRAFDYDEAGGAILQRVEADLLARRSRSARGVDWHLAGLFWAVEGCDGPAVDAFLRCLPSSAPAAAPAPPAPPAPEDAEAWFARALAPQEGAFEPWPAPGVDGGPPPETDYLYYNLGMAYLRQGQKPEARMALAEFVRQAETRPWHGLALTAKETLAELGTTP